MLTRLRIHNFKCLHDVTLELGRLTVLIGPNDSGKSSLLDALHLLGRSTHEGIAAIFRGPLAVENLLWQRDKSLPLRWEVTAFDGRQDVTYLLELRADASSREELKVGGDVWLSERMSFDDQGPRAFTVRVPGGASYAVHRLGVTTALASLAANRNEQIADAVGPLVASLRSLGRHHLSTDALRATSVPEPGDVLSPSGDNLAAVVDAILGGPDRDVRAQFEDELHAIIPTLKGVSTPPAAAGDKPGAKEVHFVLAGANGKRAVTIPGALASDGAMLVTAFLALAHGPTPDLLLIEEPENGLHPARVGQIMGLLRRMSEGKVGEQRRQILMTTHNPLFLNQARPEEVRIVQRRPDSGTHVTPLERVVNIDDMLKDFGIGELWNLLGEDALVRGEAP